MTHVLTYQHGNGSLFMHILENAVISTVTDAQKQPQAISQLSHFTASASLAMKTVPMSSKCGYF